MGAINNAFNRVGLSVLSLASATAKYRSKRNEEGKNRAKLNYSTAATIKKQNNVLTKNQSESPKSYFDINSVLSSEIARQKLEEKKALEQLVQERAKATSSGEEAGVKETVEAKKPVQRFGELAGVEEAPAPDQKALEKMEEEKTKATSFGELPTVSTENSETKIPVDEDVKKLQEVKANIEKRNMPETAKVEEPTEDRYDWHNYADKFYDGIGYGAAEEKVKEKYGKTVSELYDEETPIREKLEQLKSIIDLEKYRPTEEEIGQYHYQNVAWDRLYRDYPEYEELDKQIREKTDIANEAFRMREKLAEDSNSLTLEDFGFSKEEQDEWAELDKKKSWDKRSKNYARWEELENKRVHAISAKKDVINSYDTYRYEYKEKQEFNDRIEEFYKVWETKAKPKFNDYRGKKLPPKVQEAYDRIDNKNLTYDSWLIDLDTVNTYYKKQVMKKNKKENN